MLEFYTPIKGIHIFIRGIGFIGISFSVDGRPISKYGSSQEYHRDIDKSKGIHTTHSEINPYKHEHNGNYGNRYYKPHKIDFNLAHSCLSNFGIKNNPYRPKKYVYGVVCVKIVNLFVNLFSLLLGFIFTVTLFFIFDGLPKARIIDWVIYIPSFALIIDTLIQPMYDKYKPIRIKKKRNNQDDNYYNFKGGQW